MTSASEINAQTDSLADCLPLSIGNRLLYYFDHSRFVSDGHDVTGTLYSDTGLTECVIIGKLEYPDSVLWTLNETKDFRRHVINFATGDVSDTTMNDSVTYQLVELKFGRHRLYRREGCAQEAWPNCDVGFLFSGAILFPNNMPDSTLFYRYYDADTAFINSVYSELVFTLSIGVTVKKDSGMISLSIDWQDVDYRENANYRLQSVIISDVQAHPLGAPPTQFSLSQNYPNPFNPTTRIDYALPSISHVKLAAYSLLGQQVICLVDGILPAGHYSTELDGTGLATGVYVIMLSTDMSFTTKKIVLIR